MFWQITSFPPCGHHVFLSHSAEDRDWLVYPVYNELQTRRIIPWLDRDDYLYGRESRTALRDALLKSRHVVFFITLGMMDNRRGWCAVEAAYADILQANLTHPGAPLLNFSLPLFFLDRADAELPRTIWAALRDRGRFHTPADGDPVAWAVEQVRAFLHREQSLSIEMARVVTPGTQIHTDLRNQRDGKLERVTAFEPGPIP